MSELQPLFDYDTLAPAVREMVQEHTGEIRTLARRAAQDIVEIGQRLTQVKESLGHGQFGDWLQAEFGWTDRTARNFMQVAEVFKSANFSDLSIAPSALYALASGSTPAFICEEVVEMAQATGQRVTHQAVKERLAAHYNDNTPPPEAPESAPTPAAPKQQDSRPPAPSVDNAEMARRKKGDGQDAPSNYKPLQYDFEDMENARGELLKVPVLPDLPRQREIKQQDFQKAATRFESAAASSLTALGKIVAYTPTELRAVLESKEGRQQAASTRVQQLRNRMREALALLDALVEEGEQPGSVPLLELPSPKKDDERVLENLN